MANLEGVKLTTGVKKAIDKSRSFGMTITSGYRSPAHDKQVGGTGTGYHTKGLALDFAGSVKNMDAFASWLRSNQKALGLRTILWRVAGHYDHIHISWESNGQPSGGVVKEGNEGGLVKVIQTLLGGLTVDGIFGNQTEKAVKEFQNGEGLTPDGIVGKETWNNLTEGGGLFFSK